MALKFITGNLLRNMKWPGQVARHDVRQKWVLLTYTAIVVRIPTLVNVIPSVVSTKNFTLLVG